MKFTFILFLSLLVSTVGKAQKNFTFNQGRAEKKAYYEEIAYENFGPYLIVPVEIGGKIRKFLWDTGMPVSLTKKLAAELGQQAVTEVPVRDANGKIDTLGAMVLKELKIGHTVFREIPALMVSDSVIFFDCRGIEGVIGSNMLRKSVVQFRPDERKIILTDDIKKVNLQGSKPLDMYLAGIQSNPLITVKLKDKVSIRLLFDSGSNRLLELTEGNYREIQEKWPGIVDSLAAGRGATGMGLWGSGKDAKQYAFETDLHLGKTVIQDLKAFTMEDKISRLGVRLLDYGRVTMDYRKVRFYFTPFAGKEVKSQVRIFPITPLPEKNRVEVGMVWGNDFPDIAPGDTILEINGVNVEHMERCDFFREWVKLNVDSREKCMLRIRNRAGEIRQLELIPL